jgi:hypothetical protein
MTEDWKAQISANHAVLQPAVTYSCQREVLMWVILPKTPTSLKYQFFFKFFFKHNSRPDLTSCLLPQVKGTALVSLAPHWV